MSARENSLITRFWPEETRRSMSARVKRRSRHASALNDPCLTPQSVDLQGLERLLDLPQAILFHVVALLTPSELHALMSASRQTGELVLQLSGARNPRIQLTVAHLTSKVRASVVTVVSWALRHAPGLTVKLLRSPSHTLYMALDVVPKPLGSSALRSLVGRSGALSTLRNLTLEALAVDCAAFLPLLKYHLPALHDLRIRASTQPLPMPALLEAAPNLESLECVGMQLTWELPPRKGRRKSTANTAVLPRRLGLSSPGAAAASNQGFQRNQHHARIHTHTKCYPGPNAQGPATAPCLSHPAVPSCLLPAAPLAPLMTTKLKHLRILDCYRHFRHYDGWNQDGMEFTNFDEISHLIHSCPQLETLVCCLPATWEPIHVAECIKAWQVVLPMLNSFALFNCSIDSDDLEALCGHPTLRHVCVDHISLTRSHLGAPCQWHSLSIESGLFSVDTLAWLPLHSLTQPLDLSVSAWISFSGPNPEWDLMTLDISLAESAEKNLKSCVPGVKWGRNGLLVEFCFDDMLISRMLRSLQPLLASFVSILTLNQCRVGPLALEALALVFGSKLKILHLMEDMLEPELLASLPAVFPGLQRLRLSPMITFHAPFALQVDEQLAALCANATQHLEIEVCPEDEARMHAAVAAAGPAGAHITVLVTNEEVL